MTEDYFWGVTLHSNNKEVKWEPDALQENGDDSDMSVKAKGEHALIIKQALLSPDVPENQVNIVEVETTGYQSNIKMPIINLVGGKNSHVLLDLNFPDPPVTLRLIQGEGPIHVCGNHVLSVEQYNEDDDDDDDDDDFELDEQAAEEDEEEEEVETDEKKKEEKGGKKRANSNTAQPPPKKKKKGSKDD